VTYASTVEFVATAPDASAAWEGQDTLKVRGVGCAATRLKFAAVWRLAAESTREGSARGSVMTTGGDDADTSTRFPEE